MIANILCRQKISQAGLNIERIWSRFVHSDQIGRIFAYWEIVFFGKFYQNYICI
jgi:hypothetical protein